MKKGDDTHERLKALEEWKTHCTIVAAGAGGIWMAVTTAGAWIFSYWEDIKHFFQGLGK